MIDDSVQRGRRKRMIEKLYEKGITDTNVLDAMFRVPRHVLFDSAFSDHAYQLYAFPIGDGQTISNPFTVAIQTFYLDVQPQQKILEIGTGSGYQTAVLCHLSAKIYSIERIASLYVRAKQSFKKIGVSPEYVAHGDGMNGLESFAPFDRILVTAGARKLPVVLLNQLSVGGKLVIPYDEGSGLRLHVFEKYGENDFEKINLGIDMNFVPLLENRI